MKMYSQNVWFSFETTIERTWDLRTFPPKRNPLSFLFDIFSTKLFHE